MKLKTETMKMGLKPNTQTDMKLLETKAIRVKREKEKKDKISKTKQKREQSKKAKEQSSNLKT